MLAERSTTILGAAMKKYKVGFLMSQNLGHIVHHQRLRLEVAKDPAIEPQWMPIPPWAEDHWQSIPVVKGNLTLLSGFRAKDLLRNQTAALDALYCHTQEAALMLGKYMRRIPTILSLDATPINIDSIGLPYGHMAGAGALERVKHFLTRRTFHRAAHLVAFNEWAKNSLLHDYGIPEQKITVNMPGIDLARWSVTDTARTNCEDDRAVRVLFVGGDFRRKGGDVLLQCVRSMPENWTVDIVTSEAVPIAEGLSGLRVHRGLKADTPDLVALYRSANIFALPTLADTNPLVILEAMAMQLPVIATRVAGIPELVIHGETGLLIPPNSPEALREAIDELSEDPARRRAMGIAGRHRVEKLYDGSQTYRALFDTIKSVADRGISAKDRSR